MPVTNYELPYIQLPQYNENPVAVQPPINTLPPVGVGKGTLASTPDWLAFLIAVGVVGGVAELIGHFDNKAAYMFVALILLGFAAAGGRATAVSDFVTTISGIATNNNGNKGVK